MLSNRDLISTFSDDKCRKEIFEEKAKVLRKEAEANGYKTDFLGLTCFLDACEDRLGIEATNFYRLCIPYALS